MTDNDGVKNIICFLIILFGEDPEVLKKIFNFSPEYLIEKFNRYVESKRIEHEWGLYPGLRAVIFEPYCKKWGINND